MRLLTYIYLTFYRIVLLGQKGVGKSTLGRTLLGGNEKHFPRGVSTSQKIKIITDHFLGIGECVTIIDTPGPPRKSFNKRNFNSSEGKSSFINNYAMVFRSLIFNQKSFLVEGYRSSLEEIKKTNLFILLMKKQNMCNPKNNQTIIILKWYEDFFGKEMWKHVITEATYHQHFLQNKVNTYFGEFLELVKLFNKRSGKCVLLT